MGFRCVNETGYAGFETEYNEQRGCFLWLKIDVLLCFLTCFGRGVLLSFIRKGDRRNMTFNIKLLSTLNLFGN